MPFGLLVAYAKSRFSHDKAHYKLEFIKLLYNSAYADQTASLGRLILEPEKSDLGLQCLFGPTSPNNCYHLAYKSIKHKENNIEFIKLKIHIFH